MRQTRKNIYDVSRCTISHILELRLPFSSSRFDSSYSVPLAWASSLFFFMPRVPHTVSNQRRQLPNSSAQQTTQLMILKKHRVSNECSLRCRILHVFANHRRRLQFAQC